MERVPPHGHFPNILFTETDESRNAGCTLSPSASDESCPRRDWASATLYTRAKSSQFWRATQGDSQARYETL